MVGITDYGFGFGGRGGLRSAPVLGTRLGSLKSSCGAVVEVKKFHGSLSHSPVEVSLSSPSSHLISSLSTLERSASLPSFLKRRRISVSLHRRIASFFTTFILAHFPPKTALRASTNSQPFWFSFTMCIVHLSTCNTVLNSTS